MNFSPHEVLKASLGGDLLFSLDNRRHPGAELPFAGLTTLLLVFLSIASLNFVKGDNVLALGLVAGFISWWTTFAFSVLILLLFGMDAPEKYLRKATYLTISAITASAILLSTGLLFNFKAPYWIGESLPDGWDYAAAVIYALPYTTLCLATTYLTLRRRLSALSQGSPSARSLERMRRVKTSLWGKAIASYAAVTLFAALLIWLTVIDDNSLTHEVITAMEGALPGLAAIM